MDFTDETYFSIVSIETIVKTEDETIAYKEELLRLVAEKNLNIQ